MKIYFDLDGTLIDASERLYKLFCDLISECSFSKEEYWYLKRNKITHQIILNNYFPKYQFNDFEKKWLECIENDYYLQFDTLYEFTPKVLNNLQQNNQLYLLTARQSKKNLLKELKRFNIAQYFTNIFVTEHKKTKLELLQEIQLKKTDILIGDTGKDIETAKIAGILSAAVTYGFMSEEKLKEYNPDFLFSDLSEIINYRSQYEE